MEDQVFEVGDLVAFEPKYGHKSYGRVLAATDSEYAVSTGLTDDKLHVCWITKGEATRP